MPGSTLGAKRLTCLLVLSAVVLFPGLGSSSRLTYHEAFVAQGAREILDSGNWGFATIGGLPWLEKPPLPWWLVVILGRCSGSVNETIARLPSSLAAIGLVLGVAALASRHYGPSIGLLAGSIQATTAWTVMRGRLAEADILLVSLLTWAIVAFDRLIVPKAAHCARPSEGGTAEHWRLWRWVFFILLGMTGLVKGIGFGAVLILSVVAGVLLWQRNWVSFRRLYMPVGWALTAAITLSWPLCMVIRHGYGALTLWTMHVSDRLVHHQGSGPFAGETWWEYGSSILGQALPWTPLAVLGLWQSIALILWRGNEMRKSGSRTIPVSIISGDQLLYTWAFVPLTLLTLAPVKNAHYAISAQVPWSIWAALALARIGKLLNLRGYDCRVLLRLTQGGFVILAVAYGLGIWLLGPYFDRRGREWAFYESTRYQIPANVPLVLLYDDWDRKPYETPFGLIPHDLAVRLFYLGRPTCWYLPSDAVLVEPQVACKDSPLRAPLADSESRVAGSTESIAIIGRERDVPTLRQLGELNVIARGPTLRSDRAFSLFRLVPRTAGVQSTSRTSTGGTY